ALALMLTFLLTPAVSALQRRGLPRVPAVLLVVALALGLVVGVGWIVASQVQGLARTMPEHKDQITAKLSDLQQSSQGVFQGLVRMSREIAEELQRTQDNPDLAGGRDRPIPVVVKARESDSLTWFPVVIGPALETLATAGLILILVIFMLINREDLRNRLLSLIGRGRLTAATRALDDASARISRFLMTQLLINATFGFV